ncbi:MAG: acyl-CoA thioesterase/BAAT N-terminal domain-containing protein, partial [Alphaproteobacteria bacterium]
MPRVSVAPASALIDVPRTIRLDGFAPDAVVTVTATASHGDGSLWESGAQFRSDAAGAVDVTTAAPLAGSYDGVSPMGLVWSQAQKTPPSSGVSVAPIAIRVAADDGIGGRAEAVLEQHYMAPGVTRREVREDGLVGTLFLPPGSGPHPAVMVLNGSGGGINEPRGALYASRGYAALALGYFKAPGLSDYISNTPLEYFVRGMEWLRRTVRPKHDFMALSGQSRGGELVLLLGSMFPDAVSAVVAYVPGAVVHSAQSAADSATGREGPTWTWQGRPLPHLWENNRTATWKPYDEAPSPRRHAA